MVLVKVAEGTLEGTHEQNPFGGTFYSFKGIPYAEPPVGELRFKDPQPVKSWRGVRAADKFGSDCYQVDQLSLETEGKGSEDCLYLNVNSPNLKPAKPLPVMVWIHGGGFFSGTGSDELYGPEYLIRHDVVYVSINYRLDVLGFLCLDIPEVPGNAGLKDQVLALRWVKRNISNFGGDPENITIFGESAGGVSVSYHLMSPMSKGLFKRAIAQSGSSMCNWSNITEPLEKAVKFARILGFKSSDRHEIYKYLQSLPVEKIVKLNVPIMFDEPANMPMGLNFGPVSEKKFGDNEVFFTGDIYDVLRKGIHEGVDVMSGYTEHEGVFGLLIRGFYENISKAAEFSEFYCPGDIRYHCAKKDALEVGRKLKKYYLKDEFVTKGKMLPIVRFSSLEDFQFGSIRWQKIAAKASRNKFYLYKFTCKSGLNVFSDIFQTRDMIGPGTFVCHADDTMYLFPLKALKMNVDLKSKEFKLIETVTTLWTNFAKYGNPTPDHHLGAKWAPYTLDQQEYLDIGEQLIPGTKPEEEDVKFWEDIYRQYLPNHI